MDKTAVLERLKKDKGFFKSVAEERGLLDLFFSGYKKFQQGRDQQIHDLVHLKSYTPSEEGTEEGFGEYLWAAVPLNEAGREELAGVVSVLEQKGLMDDVGNLRFECRSTGYWMLDLPDFQESDPEQGRLRRHSTENLLIFAMAVSGEKSGTIAEYDSCLVGRDSGGKRWVMPFRGGRL